MALLGVHGVVMLLPVAAWIARREFVAIEHGRSPAAGRPWAQGALALALAGAALWTLAFVWWLG